VKVKKKEDKKKGKILIEIFNQGQDLMDVWVFH
jgi:hypothetical protein